MIASTTCTAPEGLRAFSSCIPPARAGSSTADPRRRHIRPAALIGVPSPPGGDERMAMPARSAYRGARAMAASAPRERLYCSSFPSLTVFARIAPLQFWLAADARHGQGTSDIVRLYPGRIVGLPRSCRQPAEQHEPTHRDHCAATPIISSPPCVVLSELCRSKAPLIAR